MRMFTIMHFHKYSLAEWENMEPWERDTYYQLLSQAVEAENERVKDEYASRG